MSSSMARSTVSAVTMIPATGVFSSWEALATKSRRIDSTRLRSVSSWMTTNVRPSASLTEVDLSSRRRGWWIVSSCSPGSSSWAGSRSRGLRPNMSWAAWLA